MQHASPYKPVSSSTKILLRPPITYYGGKQRMVRELLALIPEHALYVEAYMGGGALFFAKQPSSSEVINDINGEVTNFYAVLQSDFENLQRKIKATLHSRVWYDKALDIYNTPQYHDALSRAWAFWVVTNQGFSSRIGNWGVGRDNKMGKSLAGKRERFSPELSERLKHVQVESNDGLRILSRYDTPDTFFYLDPPYFNSNCGHYKGFSEDDFVMLLNSLSQLQGKFLLSCYPSPLLDQYIEKFGWQRKEVLQTFCVTHKSKKIKTEVLVFNYDPPVNVLPVDESAEVSIGEIDSSILKYQNALRARLQIFDHKSKLVIDKNVRGDSRNNAMSRLQRSEQFMCFGSNENIYDQMPSLPKDFRERFSDQKAATLEMIYRSLSNGIRSAKSETPRKWLAQHKLSIEATGTCFNSGQIHHRKSDAFKRELERVGFMIESRVGTNNGQIPFTVFGIFSVMFPLRDEKNQVTNFYAIGIRNNKRSYMNYSGIYPNYPHEMTKKLYIVASVIDAATLLESKVLDNREAVMALFDGQFLDQHFDAIKRLKHLEQIVLIESANAMANVVTNKSNSHEKHKRKVA